MLPAARQCRLASDATNPLGFPGVWHMGHVYVRSATVLEPVCDPAVPAQLGGVGRDPPRLVVGQ